MNPVDWIAIAVIAVILVGAVAYLLRQKKKGNRCVGCPYAGNCSSCKDQKGAEDAGDAGRF